jgi:putative transposase
MGSIGDCFDNALAESFFSSLQVELLDRQSWATRQQLANAIFEWIETSHQPKLSSLKGRGRSRRR